MSGQNNIVIIKLEIKTIIKSIINFFEFNKIFLYLNSSKIKTKKTGNKATTKVNLIPKPKENKRIK